MTSHTDKKTFHPTDHFETPESVQSDSNLNRDEKTKILQSMALDADQLLVTTSEGMIGASRADDAKDLQSALVQLEKVQEPVAVYDPVSQTSRFQRVLVITTVNQDLNRDITDVACGIAKVAGGKLSLLSVVPPSLAGGEIEIGAMASVFPALATDNTQIVEDRKQQLAELVAEMNSDVETEIEVRCGQFEDVVAAYTDDCAADIVVVGSPNRSWLESLLDTSMARSVTRSASCPVLV